ncbi:MAG: succinate dehydrogenase/fumarate reductase iron-sulfur subunit [Deltaproteobacteria bacterium]|jgi:succinate dehydrogenase / fumarate reductase iron-sulfur subunit|nr:succinate dehydrogenase/fumarate reductase iron-sulfur subunit [Deltaproteobacteria bacterium]
MSDNNSKKNSYNLTLKIHRYDPVTERTWIQNYDLKAGRILRFVDLFRKINEEQDPTLTWNSACEHGQCGTCSVKVNGKPLLACELLVENAVQNFGTSTFNIEPLDIAPAVRDLLVNLEKAYEKVNQVKPYIIQPVPPPALGEEYPIEFQQLERYINATRCINCFCCSSACISSHRTFLGPHAILAGIIRLMDPREQEKEERLKILYSDQGVYRCHSSRACSFVCPKQIDVAHFIALAKEGRITEKPE